MDILQPKNQLKLFGYSNYFDMFTDLIDKEKLPNCILFNGPKGLGKATFSYHIINYILSKNEENNYQRDKFSIDKKNSSYKLISANTHQNFFLIDNISTDKEIKIDQIRNLLKFTTKSSYSKNLKIVLIDNAEHLNLNSSNALLKAIEEPESNTIFFIVHNSSFKILDTIKSRCMEFKIFLTLNEKRDILVNLLNNYSNSQLTQGMEKDLIFDTPGNLLKHYFILLDNKINIEDKFSCILYFLEKYQNDKDFETLYFLSLFIEKFYIEKCLQNNKELNTIYFNKSKILNQIYFLNKYNLNTKNVLISIKDILLNEQK